MEREAGDSAWAVRAALETLAETARAFALTSAAPSTDKTPRLPIR